LCYLIFRTLGLPASKNLIYWVFQSVDYVIGIPDTCSPHYIGYLRFFFVISNVNICFVSGNLLLEMSKRLFLVSIYMDVMFKTFDKLYLNLCHSTDMFFAKTILIYMSTEKKSCIVNMSCVWCAYLLHHSLLSCNVSYITLWQLLAMI
jgi:hypothetical protein